MAAQVRPKPASLGRWVIVVSISLGIILLAQNLQRSSLHLSSITARGISSSTYSTTNAHPRIAPIAPTNRYRINLQPRNSNKRSKAFRAESKEAPERKGPDLLEFPRALNKFTHGTADDPFDLLVVGCGPSGLAVVDEAASRGLKVGLVDPQPKAKWPNNYGVWVDEFEALGHDDCFLRTWEQAKVVIDEKNTGGIPLKRAYAQVDRNKLKTKLLHRALDSGAEFLSGAVDKVDHKEEDSVVITQDGQELHAVQVLDATGHARRLVEFEREFTPGYQAAYGAVIKVDSHPYELDTMMFMDWRDDHLDSQRKAENSKLPTFLYVMPYDRNTIFVEETSLVARPFIPFDDLKERLRQRLNHMGIVLREVEEEEYCLIPMGGVLPRLPQRTLGIGGTAGMVHPATGYMVSKTLNQAPVLVDAVQAQLRERQKLESPSMFNATAASENVWQAIWPEEDRRQRTFMCFGMEILMRLDVLTTRRFFQTFFSLSQDMWGGFLSWRISSLGLLGVGLSIFQIAPNQLRFDFVRQALPYMPSFVKNFAQASNEFDSSAWAGIYESLANIYSIPYGKRDEETKTVNGGISGQNPTEKPILSSDLDFEALMRGDDFPPPNASRLVESKREAINILDSQGIGSPPPKDLTVSLPASKLTDDRDWIRFQQEKTFPDQEPIASKLEPLPPSSSVDVLVAGVGPAGLTLAEKLAARGLKVGLVGPESQFTNNYGVWYDELQELNMENVLEEVYDDTLVQIDDKGLKPIGRRYGRVSRKLLRDELINRCAKNGVKYYEGLVDSVQNQRDGTKLIRASEGAEFGARVVAMSTGHNREVLEYEEGSPPAWQTAYGIEIDAPDHPWEPNKAVFMDLTQSDDEIITSMGRRIPSFLYVLPSKDKVFIEETCLVSKVQVPFDELKRRLYRRLEKLDFKFDQSQIIEEEASWIPLGGSLPKVPQQVVAFGAAAGLVHPATGYSIINSLKMAEPVAEAIASGLQSDMGAMGSTTASAGAWKAIWGAENRRKMAFYQFGSDLIAKMPLGTLREFMRTFYSLPPNIWKGFLSHRLTSPMLVPLALLMFAYGNDDLRMALVSELASPAGASLIKTIFDAQGAENAAHNEADLLARDEEDADLMIRRVSPLREPLKGVFRREQLSESGPSGFAK